MKRYLCTVAAGLGLALTSTATASADIGLPLPGQSGTQETNLGDQTVGEQRNDADVTQEQGNGNVAISPAIAVFGDAETTNAQGNGNVADSDVDQENEVEQSQDSHQEQSLAESGTNGCCDGQSQTGQQNAFFGDQTVGEQRNDADVTQEQGNGNIAVSPAIAIFGDAETTNYQGNGNYAESDVDQENEVEQSQDSHQEQSLAESGSGSNGCCDGQSQTGEQKTYGGDQTVDKQRNDADVTQKQGNGNVAISPAIAIFGDAETRNSQGNGNVAKSDVDQENEVEQKQESTQKQTLKDGGSCCRPTHDPCKSSRGCEPKKEHGKQRCCEDGQSQTGEQKTSFGDQTVGEQRNDADVTQEQGNDNFALSPAVGIGGGLHEPCNATCGKSRLPLGGDAETSNSQGNGNVAKSDVDQENEVEQKQESTQKQTLIQDGGSCCRPAYDPCKTSHGCQPEEYDPKRRPSCSSKCEPQKDYAKRSYAKDPCCERGRNQTGEQKTSFGDQHVGEQRNDADVAQKQGNDNAAVSPAVGFGGGPRGDSCGSTCGKSPAPRSHGALTRNEQGNRNYASSDVDQENEVEQKQSAYQRQDLVEMCKGLIYR